MNERTRTNLFTILILIIELAIFGGLFYLVLLVSSADVAPGVFMFSLVMIFLFSAVISGITIGYLGHKEDVLKIAIGMMVFTTASILFLLFGSGGNEGMKGWVYAVGILGLLACDLIIYFVSDYTMKRNLKKNDLEIEFEIIEQPQNDHIS